MTIGENIRSVRRLRGMTAEELAQAIQTKCDYTITDGAIRRWERNERSITVDDLIMLAVSLECSLQTLLDGLDPRMGDVPETHGKIGMLSPEDHQILRHLATDWRGDIHALIVADGVYGCLPERLAMDAIMHMMELLQLGIQSGEIRVKDLPQGLPYLEEKIGGLANGKTGK